MTELMTIDTMVKFASCYIHNARKMPQDLIDELRENNLPYSFVCLRDDDCFAKEHYKNWSLCTFDLKKDEMKRSLISIYEQRYKEKWKSLYTSKYSLSLDNGIFDKDKISEDN